jgi:type IV secretory pathway VirB10-like protein
VQIIYAIFLIFATSLFLCPASAEENKAHVFTNEDLKRHRQTETRASVNNSPSKESATEKKRHSIKTSGDSGKDKWCKNGTHYQNRVDAAKAAIKGAEAKRAEAETKADRNKTAKRKAAAAVSDASVRKAKNNLERAEKQLSDLEQDAHRKGIPPGWLRCQFSY